MPSSGRGVGIAEFPVPHGLGFAFLGVFKHLQGVGEQRPVKKPQAAMVLEACRHGHVPTGVHVGGLAPFGHRFHPGLLQETGQDREMTFPSHGHKMRKEVAVATKSMVGCYPCRMTTARTIQQLHPAVETPMADLVTFRALPTGSLPSLNPFLFLNHHGPQVYPPNNGGLPFGPHPHKGFETLTFVFDGQVAHSDSTGETFVTGPGGVQWMTAGRGIEHAEVSPDGFLESGGLPEIIQVWMNLLSSLKRTEPWYRGFFESEELLHVSEPEGLGRVRVAGEVHGQRARAVLDGPVHVLVDAEAERALCHGDSGGPGRHAVRRSWGS